MYPIPVGVSLGWHGCDAGVSFGANGFLRGALHCGFPRANASEDEDVKVDVLAQTGLSGVHFTAALPVRIRTNTRI